MYSVSEGYKGNIYAPSRMIKGRVTFDISDTTIEQDTINTSVSNQFEISDKEQLTDKKRQNTYNYSTFENDRFKLDGSFSFADDTLTNNDQVGWCSDDLCDSFGDFINHLTLTFDFGMNHSSMGVTVTFDTHNNEYATDFDVNAYDSVGTLIYSVQVTNNTKVQYAALGQFNDYRTIEVVIKKWNIPHRRARVAEVDFGVVKVYTDDNLIQMGLIEELDLTTGRMPSPEFNFTVDNSDRGFNILNPTGFYKYLQERQQVNAELGVEKDDGSFEYIPIGKYLLWEWTSDEGSLTASFTTRTNLDIMDTFDYENTVAKSNYSLHQMAIDMFEMCSISNYYVDPALQDIYTNGLVKKTSCKSILQMVSIAGCANVFVTRDNIINLVVSPQTIGDPDDIVDMDNMYKEPKIELDKIVKSVNVSYFTDLDTSDSITIQNGDVSKGDSIKLENNTLINSSSVATDVADWILRQKSYRSIYTLNWRGNPAHELEDIISIQNTYGSNMSAYITKNELSYKGYLTGKTEARGVAN